MKSETKAKSAKISKESFLNFLGIFSYIRPYMGYFIAGMIMLVIGSMLFMAIPGLASEMANSASGKSRFPFTVNQYALILGGVVLFQGLLSYGRVVCFATVSERGMAAVRTDLYEKIICQPYTYYEHNRIGEITSRLTVDISKLQQAFAVTLAEFLRQIVQLIVGILYLIYFAPSLSLTMLLTFPFIVVGAMIFGRYIRKLSRQRQDALAESNTIVEETLQSFSAVKAFTNEWYESIRYSNSIGEVVKISLHFAQIRGIFFIFIISVLFGAIIFILWRGAILVQSGEMLVGDLFGFILYTGIIGGSIAGLGSLYTNLASAIGATERVQELLAKDVEVALEDGKAEQFARFHGDIELNNVEFSYPTRKDVIVLKDIDLKINHGQSIALVGQSGSGKSTIVQLLMRFFDVDKGAILIDGKENTSYNVSDYRKNIGTVPQEVILFGGTIRENIRYGKPNATDDEIKQAASKANCMEFIESFPDQLETLVGERGIKLSGGQRQRIAIARAILKDPSILILDEATSSLDAESEAIVQEALNNLMEGRTTIIIAHRLATIRDVDKIYVIDKGKIVEAGTHDELMLEQNGIYKSLATLQFELV